MSFLLKMSFLFLSAFIFYICDFEKRIEDKPNNRRRELPGKIMKSMHVLNIKL